MELEREEGGGKGLLQSLGSGRVVGVGIEGQQAGEQMMIPARQSQEHRLLSTLP